MRKAPLLFEDHTPGGLSTAANRGAGRGVTLVVLIFLGTRLVAWTGAYTGAAVVFCIRQQWEPPFNQYLKKYRDGPPDPDSPEYRSAIELFADFAPLSQFDGLNYKSVIEYGYQYEPPSADAEPYTHQQNIAFFPVYPLLCRLLTGFATAEAAMVLVAQACGLAAAIVLYLWVRWRVDPSVALFTVAAVFCAPAACYYSFAYAESLTLLLLVSALWLMDRRAFVAAACVCGLLTATRPTALGIVPVFMLAYWFNDPQPHGRPGVGRDAPAAEAASRTHPTRRRLVRLVVLSLVAASGAVIYATYLAYRFGSPMVYLANFKAGWVPNAARAEWVEFVTLAPVWSQLGRLGWAVTGFPLRLADPFTWSMALSVCILLLSLVGLRRVPRSFRPLLLLGPFIFVHCYVASGGAGFGLDPMARYMGVSVPAFVVLAAWCTREWKWGTRCALLTFMVLLQAAWALRFGLREWSG